MMRIEFVSLKEFFGFLIIFLVVIFLEALRAFFIFGLHFNLFLIFLVFSLNYLGIFEYLILGAGGFFIFNYLFFQNFWFFLGGCLMLLLFYFFYHKFFEKNNLFGILILIFLGEILINSFFGIKYLFSFSFLFEIFPTLILATIIWGSLKFFE